MASYKEGNERLSQTGGGMDGIELSTYQQWVTKNVCKYYFELDSVLRDRPNVTPWYTNEKVMTPRNNIEKTADNRHIDYTVLDDDDDSDLESLDQPNNEDSQYCIIDEEREVVETMRDDEEDDEYDGNGGLQQHRLCTNTTSPVTLTPLSEDSNSTSMDTTNNSSSDEYPSSSTMGSTTKKKEKSKGRVRELLPSEAKGIQRNLLRKKKKSIAQKTTDGITNNIISIDNEDRDMIKETRDAKMNFDRERYDHQKK